MAKKIPAAAAAPETKTEPTTEKPAADKSRGPKGVPETAKITMLVKANPKREGSKARGRFDAYKDGMTVKEALDAGVTTPDLVYDTKHGFISIEGYSVPGGVLAPKEPKPPKAKKEKAEKDPNAEANAAAVAAATTEETMA